jgi:hydrogenase maturation protease
LHSHSFRWDHALAFARWLLKEGYPEEIQVYLIQIDKTDFGAPLSRPVEKAMGRLVKRIVNSFTEEGFVD